MVKMVKRKFTGMSNISIREMNILDTEDESDLNNGYSSSDSDSDFYITSQKIKKVKKNKKTQKRVINEKNLPPKKRMRVREPEPKFTMKEKESGIIRIIGKGGTEYCCKVCGMKSKTKSGICRHFSRRDSCLYKIINSETNQVVQESIQESVPKDNGQIVNTASPNHNTTTTTTVSREETFDEPNP